MTGILQQLKWNTWYVQGTDMFSTNAGADIFIFECT